MTNIKSSKEDRNKILDDELETPENTPEETSDEEDTPENEDIETPEEESEDEPEDEDSEEETSDEEDTPETPPIEERYRNSTREAQILHSKTKKFTESVKAAADLTEPTEEELKAEYSDWDDMTETEQRLAKRTLMSERKFNLVHGAVLEGEKITEWEGKVDEFLK